MSLQSQPQTSVTGILTLFEVSV